MYKVFRYQLAALNIPQTNYLFPSTETNYLALAKDKKFEPDTIVLPSGTKAHWFGNKSADKIILYLHGGGYVMGCGEGHNKWLFEVTDDLSKKHSLSSILLQYTCAPDGQYPDQLRQAVELLDHLINKAGRNPRDIIIAGDSAGGNLALALISHILHPHPDIPTKIELKEPFLAAVLISPWVDFDHTPSWDRNAETDLLCKPVGALWSSAFIGNAPRDGYNQPVKAPAGWFSKLDTVVSDLFIWGGSGEVLIDSINEMAKQLKSILPKTQYVVEVSELRTSTIEEALTDMHNSS